LANPAQPIATSLGVANQLVAPLMAAEMAARGRTALVFRGEDGLDELTTTGTSQIWQVSGGEVQEFTLNPSDFGIKRASIQQLIGGDAQANAETANRLFAGETAGNIAAIRDIVILNAAGGVVAYELAKDASRAEVGLDVRFEDAILRVTNALDSGAAQARLTKWIAATQL
jgi:anthranilate phosphoribosyltransferase